MKVFVFGPLIIVYKENEEAFGPPFFLSYLKRPAIMYKFLRVSCTKKGRNLNYAPYPATREKLLKLFHVLLLEVCKPQ